MTSAPTAPQVILASASQSRARLLEQVGLAFTVMPARVDEEAIKDAMLAEQAAHIHIAETLAEIKALQVSQKAGNALVIGADQVLSAQNILYNKPCDRDDAHRQLSSLSGQEHELFTAVCVAQNGNVIWRRTDRAKLKMRKLSEAFIDSYLNVMGDAALMTVGCYQLEDRGPLLFEDISGDYYGILGLPLLPLLQLLRMHRVISS